MIDYKERIRLLKAEGKGLMSRKQYMSIAEELSKRCPCNLLVFGLGHDSYLWNDINLSGLTIFLEDDEEWMGEINDGSLNIYKVKYNTKIKNHASINFDEEKLHLDLPDEVENSQWDFVIVDAPLGHQPPRPFKGPGRMSSIYHAHRLLREGGFAIVDDLTRPVERLYSYHYFGEENMFNIVDDKVGFFIK